MALTQFYVWSKVNAPKKTVNARRINRERMRVKLAKASFIAVPRLVKA
jgi:hypothetical protein